MRYCALAVLCCWLAGVPANAAIGGKTMDITIETRHARLVIGTDARVRHFVDKHTKRDFAVPDCGPVASVSKSGKTYPASAASFASDHMVLDFGDSGVSAAIGITKKDAYVIFEVLSMSGAEADEFTFADIHLSLKGTPDETFAACALSLNLRTNVVELPRAASHLAATCYRKFGFEGAKVALIGCPTLELRKVMQEIVADAPDLPHSSMGGPWALDSPANRGSYLFNFGGLSEQNVDQWIALAKNLGIKQIDFHGGDSFRFGDCRPNPTTYPRGRESFKAVIDKLHAAGILAGLHTYAFFMDKSCKWVTPSPDPGLAKDATFTLANSLDAAATLVPVNEPTKDMSTVTGFFVVNSVTLQIDDELITYSGISKEQPYAFTSCTRGACGTKPTPHAAGAKVHHLKEMFGLFTPDPDSDLFTRVVQASADMYNECGFDMIYLDALDGEGILGGSQHAWHYGSKFVFELFTRLKKSPIMEMSTFHHHLWYVRSRMGAWDHPSRSHKRFIDIHCRANENCRDMFLPAHLGWWAIIADSDPRRESTFSDDIEYLCAKCAGWDCGLSPQGFTPESYASSYNLRRLASIIKRWEDLRSSGHFTESVRAKLRAPGDEFTLGEQNGKPVLRPMQCDKHKVEGLSSPSSNWQVSNKFGPQQPRLRIQALFSAGPYDSPDAITLADFRDLAQFATRESAPGVTADLRSSTDKVKSGEASGLFTAARNGGVAHERGDVFSVHEHGQRRTHGGDPAWASARAVFSPVKDLTGHEALGVWVHGDGRGELLNLQLTSPSNLVAGIGDHYVMVDFTGWRYFELIEPEGERVDDYRWPYTGNSYLIYRELVIPAQVASLSIWLNNLPSDQPVACYVSPAKALPLVKTKLANPSVTINGQTITFAVEIESGCYLEYSSPTDCKLYNAQGDPIADVKPSGDARLEKGDNEVSFACEPPAGGVSARAIVTVIGEGSAVR